jgi:hypothetical protein
MLGWRLLWIWCWIAYHIWRRLPIRRYGGWYWQLQLWFLSYGGAYGYSDDFRDFRTNWRKE